MLLERFPLSPEPVSKCHERCSPCQLSLPPGSGLLPRAWAAGHAESEVGLALVSAAHHVRLQRYVSAAGLN